jgi:siroheme synthase
VTLLTGSQALSGAVRNFQGLSAPIAGQTFVFYMGFQHVAAIAQDLLRHGVDPATYALCGSQLSWPEQRVLTAPLGEIGEEMAKAELTTPAVFVVGDVVAFWKKLGEHR